MSPDTQDADQVLLSFRRRRSTPACYPCSRRKVKCRGGRPCEACKARGHPAICLDEEAQKPKRQKTSGRRLVGGLGASGAGQSTEANCYQLVSPPSSGSPSRPRAPSLNESYAEPSVGRFSAINFVRERLNNAHNVLNSDVHPSIGLGNTDNRPLSVAPLTVASSNPLMPPTRREVIQYYPPFRDSILVLYAFVYDIAALDSTLHAILIDPSKVEPQHIAVSLALLALGAQFAENVERPRREISRAFIDRSTAYLQLANYIFQPTMEVVQALLMVGMALQNCGQSDGAWALLGLNYRLAQTLGLHRLDRDDGQGAMLWSMLIWQDALISLRYDRPPLSHGMGIKDVDPRNDLTYHQAVLSNCLLAIDMLQASSETRTDIQYVLRSVNCLDHFLLRCRGHLQPHEQLRTFQQRLEYLALKFHGSLVLAEICRPTFSISGRHDDETTARVRKRGLDSLVANIETYLEICTFSNVPLRLWSMIQGAVSCALVLALIENQISTTVVKTLLTRLVGALKLDTGSRPTETLQGVCLMRVKATRLLETILSDTSASSSIGNGTDSPASFPEESLGADNMAWPVDLSLFDQAFADSVLNFDLASGLDSGVSTRD